ncbi:MAG: hypothetical protein AAGI53_17225 [Planctomycetota bacterium]
MAAEAFLDVGKRNSTVAVIRRVALTNGAYEPSLGHEVGANMSSAGIQRFDLAAHSRFGGVWGGSSVSDMRGDVPHYFTIGRLGDEAWICRICNDKTPIGYIEGLLSDCSID